MMIVDRPAAPGLVIRPCASADEWDRFVGRVPWATPQHAFAWGTAVSDCFGFAERVYWLAYRDGRAVAGLPLLRFTAGGPFRGLYSLLFDSYGGPLVDPGCSGQTETIAALLAELDAEATAYGAFEARMMVPPTAPVLIRDALATGQPNELSARPCPVLDLDRPLDEIVAGYRPAVRRAVRRSKQQDVEVIVDGDLDLVRSAYPIYTATRERIGGSIKPWPFLERLIESGLAIGFVAVRRGRPVGLVVLLVTPHLAMYWISAADPAESDNRPTNALVDAAIAWCHGRRIERFGFGESPGEREGLTRFKQGWGPGTAYSATWVRTYSPRLRRCWEIIEPAARRGYGLWQRCAPGTGRVIKAATALLTSRR